MKYAGTGVGVGVGSGVLGEEALDHRLVYRICWDHTEGKAGGIYL